MTSDGQGDEQKVERKCGYMFECANIKLWEDEKREQSRQRGSKVGRQAEGWVDVLGIEGKQGKGWIEVEVVAWGIEEMGSVYCTCNLFCFCF